MRRNIQCFTSKNTVFTLFHLTKPKDIFQLVDGCFDEYEKDFWSNGETIRFTELSN